MLIRCDCHLHTLASGHAYSTIDEYARAAAERGLELIAMTDHAPAMPGGAHPYHFENLKVLPSTMYGVEVLKGIEANILDPSGRLDVPDELLGRMEFVIASMHTPCMQPGTKAENTAALVNAMQNGHIRAIGHPDDLRYELDYEEINNSSLLPTSFRVNAREAYLKLLAACIKHEVRVIVDSDAHYHGAVGEHAAALSLLAETGYDENLVVNATRERLKAWLALKKI